MSVQPPLRRCGIDCHNKLRIRVCRKRTQNLLIYGLGLNSPVGHPKLAERFTREDKCNRCIYSHACQSLHFGLVKLGIALGAAVPQGRLRHAVYKYGRLAVIHFDFALCRNLLLILRNFKASDLIVDVIIADNRHCVIKLHRVIARRQELRHGYFELGGKFLTGRP